MLFKARKAMQILTPPSFFPTVTIEEDQGLSEGWMITKAQKLINLLTYNIFSTWGYTIWVTANRGLISSYDMYHGKHVPVTFSCTRERTKNVKSHLLKWLRHTRQWLQRGPSITVPSCFLTPRTSLYIGFYILPNVRPDKMLANTGEGLLSTIMARCQITMTKFQIFLPSTLRNDHSLPSISQTVFSAVN